MAFRIKVKQDREKQRVRAFKAVGEIRKSQSITTYGPGSLIDFPRLSGIINGIDNWESSIGKDSFSRMKIHDRNLERILGKKFFIQPQMVAKKGFVSGISITRFPEYCYCPECGILDRYYRIERKTNNTTDYNSDTYCAFCYEAHGRNVKLIPSRFVTSCSCGHMEDFPYDRWVHRNRGRCSNPRLSISISTKTNSLDGIIIKCQCGASETMEGVMDKGALYQSRCFGSMPWLGRTEDYKSWYSEKTTEEPCEEELRVLQRGANNVYYPSVVSALTIPPYSSRIQRLLLAETEKLTAYYEMPDELRSQNLRYYYDTNKDRLRCEWSQFINELEYALGVKGTGYNSLSDLIKGEYAALCDEDCNDPGFQTIEVDVPEEFTDYIDQVIIVGRLREVQVLQGFSRIYRDEDHLAPLSRNAMSWLPGNELYGEGIFIRMSAVRVIEWEQANATRYKPLLSRAKKNFFARKKIADGGVRYILLHTMAHLLIKELTLNCGYTAASIKEKIFSSVDGDSSMCGILIYTASSDSDGSLGGLARQGVTSKLRDSLLCMLESASWCSNDTVCADSTGQGVAALNYAACHACSLLPETSCECSNTLLDRGALIGSGENRNLGYFSRLMNM